MKIAIVVPTLGRPDSLPVLLNNLRQTTSIFYKVYFVVDEDDAPTRRRIAALEPSVDFCEVVCSGSYPVKVNAGMNAGEEELVLPCADDVIFHPRWYEEMVGHFAGDVDVVGTLDLTPSTEEGKHVTMPIIRRSYIEDPGAAFGEPGVCFHEGYHHNFVETELWELARARGVAVFEPASVIEHLHPAWGTRKADATDAKGNQANWHADIDLYKKRRAAWTA